MQQDTGEKSSHPIGDWARSACWHWRVSCRGAEVAWAQRGERKLPRAGLGSTHWSEASWTPPLALPNSPRAASPQLRQPAVREHGLTNQKTIGWKFYNTDEKTLYHVRGLEESILSKRLHYPRKSTDTDSMQSLSNYQWYFSCN